MHYRDFSLLAVKELEADRIFRQVTQLPHRATSMENAPANSAASQQGPCALRPTALASLGVFVFAHAYDVLVTSTSEA